MNTWSYMAVCQIALSALIVCPRAYARETTLLPSEDERAYLESHASWQRIAEENAKVGLPPFGDEPQREYFIGFSVARQAEQIDSAAAVKAAEIRWQQKMESAQPMLRNLIRPNATETIDYRSTVAHMEKSGY